MKLEEENHIIPALNCSQTLDDLPTLSSGFQLSVKMATSTFHCDLNQQLAPAQSKSCSFHFFGGKHFSPTDQSEKVTNSTSMGQTLFTHCPFVLILNSLDWLFYLYHQTEKFTNLTNTILQNRSLHFSLFWQLGKSPTDKIQSFQSNLHQLLNSFTFNHQVLKSHFSGWPKPKPNYEMRLEVQDELTDHQFTGLYHQLLCCHVKFVFVF